MFMHLLCCCGIILFMVCHLDVLCRTASVLCERKSLKELFGLTAYWAVIFAAWRAIL